MIKTRLAKLYRASEWLQKRFTSRALILMYHRVAEVELDPWSLCVSPQNFAQHLEVLRKYAHPLSLQELTQAHQSGKIPHKAVVITFDDGYVDNLHHAKTLLERYDIPATVFITTGTLGQNREFWWDELERLLLKPGKLPDKLCLELNGTHHSWELGKAANYSQAEYRGDRHLKAWDGKPGSRLAFYYSVWQKLRLLPMEKQQQALDQIIAWADADQSTRYLYRPLTLGELSSLEADGLVEIGAHTVTHPSLSSQSINLQQTEISQSKADLEALLKHPIQSFAYPFGDYTKETVNLIKKSEFACACSTVANTVWKNSDHWQFPRFEVQNWHSEKFQEMLLMWLHNS